MSIEYVPVVFARNRRPISLLIRLFTWSRWSHCAYVDGDTIIEARGGYGVITTPRKEFEDRYTDVEYAWMPIADTTDNAHSRAIEHLGKDYDVKALLGILFRTSWNSRDSWFCSENLAYVSGLFRHDRISRITPESIWRICK